MKKRLLVFALTCCFIAGKGVFASDNTSYLYQLSGFKSDNNFSNTSWEPYIDKIKKELNASWFPPRYRDEVEVTFKITPDGLYKDIRIVNPSVEKEVSQAAIDAIMFASPFEPLPHQVKDITVKYTFPGEVRQAKNNKTSSIQVLINN
jgi:TonB family protein